MSDIETALRRAVAIHGSIRKASQELEFSQDAASRVLKGEGVGSENLKRFREALGLPEDAPLRHSAAESGIARGTPVAAPAPTPIAAPEYSLREAETRGRSIEIEALLAYALERQRMLTRALGGAWGLTPSEVGEALDRAIARQTTPDVLADPDPARARG